MPTFGVVAPSNRPMLRRHLLASAALPLLAPLARSLLPRDARWVLSPSVLDALPALLAEHRVPGVAGAVVEAGEVVQRFAAGVRDARTREPMTAATPAPGASLAKPVVAWAALRMAQAGALDLDRPLATLAPPALFEGSAPAVRTITTRHVLSHATGLPNWRRSAEPLAVSSRPGTSFGYSGEAFCLLAAALEQVAGGTLESVMQAQVLQPLGMAPSTFVAPPSLVPLVASGHDDDGRVSATVEAQAAPYRAAERAFGRGMAQWTHADALRAVPIARPDRPPVPLFALPNAAASLLTTAEAYARFAAVLGGGGPVALERRWRDDMLRPHVPIGEGLGWGLGWALQEGRAGEPRLAWHWGDNERWKNFVLADPARGRALVVLANGSRGTRVYSALVRAATGGDQPALGFRMLR